MKSLKMIVVSDLHCHHSSKDDASYLTSDLLRSPTKNHPVESLISLIEKEPDFSIDITICPGDFTNKCDTQGFISGWNYVHEINDALKGSEIIATVGNHDVDSYGTNSDYNLEVAKGIKKGFPLKIEKERDIFWSKGCVFVEREMFRVLVINSSHFHYNQSNSKSGKVDSNLLDYVEQYLTEKGKDDKIQIALAHHHPIDHSRLDLGEEDKITNGSELMKILCEYQFDLFIHGHKHDALLRNYIGEIGSYSVPVLSSGSFSAKSNISWTSKRNQFHEIEIKKIRGKKATGIIRTWTFFSKQGWKLSYDEEAFPPHSGFGFEGAILNLVTRIQSIIGEKSMVKWEEILTQVPEISNLLPVETLELVQALDEKGLAVYNKKPSDRPECIFNKNGK